MTSELVTTCYRVDQLLPDGKRQLLLITESKNAADALLQERKRGRAILTILSSRGVENKEITELCDGCCCGHPLVTQALSLLGVTEEAINLVLPEVTDFDVTVGEFIPQ